MNIPHTYREWAQLFKVLEKGTDDQEVLVAMQQGTIEWQSGVAERFSQRLVNTVNARMDNASDRFNRNLAHTNGNESMIVRELLGMRKDFQFLYQVMSIPAIPADSRSQYQSLIQDQANQTQSSLEDSAKMDHTGKMSSIVKNNRVNTL